MLVGTYVFGLPIKSRKAEVFIALFVKSAYRLVCLPFKTFNIILGGEYLFSVKGLSDSGAVDGYPYQPLLCYITG